MPLIETKKRYSTYLGEEAVLSIVEITENPKSGSGSQRRTKTSTRPRIYFQAKGENVLEGLTKRHFRPVDAYRQLLPEVFQKLELPVTTKATWSQHAGCSMCPCSPGFVVSNASFYPNDIWVDVTEKTLEF